ncbi:hypothetical protein [Spirulina major]|uniref:hypothetical protein n=1 Tax=Spirulina major TaxID=270636 RepID=UPI00232C790B|nr:hypothetical protein [Spirulina major]
MALSHRLRLIHNAPLLTSPALFDPLNQGSERDDRTTENDRNARQRSRHLTIQVL